MGDGAAPIPTANPPVIAGPPPPPPTDDKEKGDKPKAPVVAAASPAAPPPNEAELKKITSEVQSAGVKIPPEFLDEKGNIKPDQVAAAKKFIAEEAAKRKEKDLGAAARLYQRALKLDPEDKQLRIDAAKTTKAWADTQKKPDVKKALLAEAVSLLKPGKDDAEQVGLLGDYARELASLHLQDGKMAEARQVLASVAPRLNEAELDKTYAFLADPANSDLLEEGEHPWMFLGDALMQERNFALAAFAYNRGVNAAQKEENIPLREEFNNKWSLANEGEYPYGTEFADPATGQVGNAAANAFYRSLQAQGIPSSAMDKEVDGKSDRKISAQEVYAYISEHLDDPKVQAVLAMAKINIAEEDKKHVKTVGFGIWMADHYTKEAERLKKEDATKNADGIAKLLTFAADLDPDNPKRAEALGDFYADQKAYPLAMQAYAEAQKAYKAMPPPNKNPRAMEGFTQMQEEAAKRLKGKIDDMFEKGLKATGKAYEQKDTDLPTKLKLVQTLEGQYELYSELYPEEVQKPERIQQMGLTYDLIAQNLKAAGKKSEAKAYFAKAAEKYQAAINANKNDAVFCIQTYKMMGNAQHETGEYKAALISFSLAEQCRKLRIHYNPRNSDKQLPTLSSVKQDRAPGQLVFEKDLGNYIHSDVHDIRRIDGLDAIPDWAAGPRDSYIQKLEDQIQGGAAYRQGLREKTPPDLQGVYDSLEEEAKLLGFFKRDDQAKAIGEEAAQVKLQVDHQRLSAEVDALGKAGILDQKGLDAVVERENKGQANPLKFGDYVKFERSGDKVTFKFTPAYEKLDTESQNRVMHALTAAAQRNQISRNAEQAKGPAKLFYEGQLAVFDEDRTTAKSKFEQFTKEAKDSQDPMLRRMLQQTQGVMQILERDAGQKPSDVMRDLRIVLAPLAMTLKPGQDGGLDLSAISKTEVKSFEDFRQYLASQVSVDGVNFNAAIFASYEKVLKSPKHEALLKHLYAEFNPDAAGDAPKMTTEQLQTALRDFQRDIIDVSAGRFVGNQLSSKEGRGRLRALLSDETLDKGIRAKLCEEIVEQGERQGYASSAMVVAFDEKVNTYGFWLQEGKLDIALRYGFRVLDAGDHQDVTRNAHIEKYEKYPQEIQRLQSDALDHSVTPTSIQAMAKMVQAQSGKSDGVSIMRAKLGTMWLTVVDNDSWGVESAVDRHKSYVHTKQRAEMANTLHRLLSEADKIGTEQEFLDWSQRVRRFMRGQGSGQKDDIAAKAGEYLGKGVEDLVGEAGEKLSWAVSDTTEDAFKGLKPAVAHSYNDLLRYVDEIHVSNLHGVSVEVLDPDVAVTDPAQKEKTMKLIQDLRGMKRGFWYNYQQRNFLSRSMSEQGEMVGVGDITSINAANKEIDGLIADLQKAKTTEDFEKIKARMTRATREGGAIHKGFADSEMEGTEQVINLVQTIAEIVVITVATQGLGTEAALGRAAATFGQTALRTRNLRMAYQAFSEVRSVANMARAAETLEMANMARYGSLYREMQGASRLAALSAEDAAIAKGFQGVFARGAHAIGGEVGFASKAASGFKMGATISLTENMIGSLSGQLKTDPTTLLDWLKDATATGLSMVVSAGLSPTVGEQVQQNIVKGLWQRYVAGGAKSAVHFLADTGLEVVEEVVDNYVRKKLDGDFSKLSFDELRDITMVCFIGGVKQGVTSHFTNFTKSKIADYQVKKLNQGFTERGERIVQDPKRGYVLVDREGNYLRKVDDTAMQAFLVYDAETHGDNARGIALVEFESGEKGAKGKPIQTQVQDFPVVQGEAKPKTQQEIQQENETKAAVQRERSVQKAKNEKQRKLYGQFLEKGQKVEEVRRSDGVILGLALVDSKGKKVRDATVDELAAYQRYVQLVEGFEKRGERVVGTPSQGYLLADSKGNKIGDASQADLSLYLKHKKAKAAEEVHANAAAAQKKAFDERESARLADFEAGYGYRLKKRGDGVTLGVEKFDARSGKAVETNKSPTKEDLESYQAFVAQRMEAKSQADAEAKLQEGFAAGQQIVLNADTGKYELQDAKGKKLRVATDAEQKLFSDFQTKKQEHEIAVGKRAEALAPEFDSGVVIRPQIKKADTYEKSNANDPNAAAFEGTDGKVSYFVKVKPDGARERPTQKEIRDYQAGKAPKDEVVGFEKVDAKGNVLESVVSRTDYEAYGAWQKAEAVAKAEKQDAEGGKVLPFPAVEGGKYLSEAALREAREQAADHAFDQLAAKGPVDTGTLVRRTQDAMDSLRFMESSLAKLPEAERAKVQDGILRQVTEGKMTREQAMELAERLQVGEAELVPSTTGEYGYVVKSNPKGQKVGTARFRPITEVEAKAGKIAKAQPSPERIARFEKYLIERMNYDPADAKVVAEEWAVKVIEDARAHQAGRTHIYDTSLPAKPENLHLDRATVDHHGRFANKKNSTEQLIDRMELALDVAKFDPKSVEAAKKDKGAMDAARQGLAEAGVKEPSEQQVAEIAAGLRELNLREVTTDNLADGAWSVWIAKHQARVLADPALRKLIGEATRFEDFTAFGTTYDAKDPGVRMQAALFQKYGEILQRNGIVGSDRFPPDKAHQVMGEALAAIDKMVADPQLREAAASEFFAKVEEARQVVLEQGVMKDVSVTEGDTQLIFVDLTKLGKFTVFQQWLAIPRAEVTPGKPHTMQVSVVPLGKAKTADGKEIDAPRTLQIVAIPDGRQLPSGKTMLDALARMNARELAKAEELGLVPKEGDPVGPGQVPREQYASVWFGKENVILPNPAKGTLLSPKEVSGILTDRVPGSKDAPLEMFAPKADQDAAIQGVIDSVLPADPNAKRIEDKGPPSPPPNDGSGTRIERRGGRLPSNDNDARLQPSEIDRTPAASPASKRGSKLTKADDVFTREILRSAIYRGVYQPAADIQSKGEMVRILEAWVMSDAAPKGFGNRKKFLEELKKGHTGEPGGKILLILDGELHIDTPERARARLEWRETMLGALQSTSSNPPKALREWLESPEAPKTFEARQKFAEDLTRGARGEPDGKVLMTDADGKVRVETFADVKARLEAGKEFIGELSKGKSPPPREVQEALMWRAALMAGKRPAEVREDLAYAVEQFPKLREQIQDLPKDVARDLSLRFLRGDVSFFNAKQFTATFRQARANAEKLGIPPEQFDAMIQKQAQQWQVDYGKHPSVAVEASLKNTAPVLEVLSQAAALMTPENRQATMQRFVDGKITIDQAYEVMTAQTLGGTFDAIESGLKAPQVKEMILSSLDGVYPPQAPPHIRKTWENYLKAQDPLAVLEGGFAGTAFNLQLHADNYAKLAESLKGLDPQSQASLLVYLHLRMEKLFGPASTSGGITTADRANAETLFRGTELLAKQLKGLDPAARQKLVADLLSGRPSLEMAIMDADMPLVRPSAADGEGTRVEKLPLGVAQSEVTPLVTVKVPKPEVTDYRLPEPFEAAADLKKEVVFLASGTSPFAAAARQVIDGKITTVEAYREAQKKVGDQMVAEHKPALDEVMVALNAMAADPKLGISKEFPPKGRMKAPDDIGPKLVRRGWGDASALTDVAGGRIVVRNNADAEAVLTQLQAKGFKIREVYSKEGDIELDVMTPEAKKAQGVGEESGVVWLDAKLDRDSIHRLVEGHPASGYRALHVVVEVNGKPVEIQIKTEAMHEWGEIEHKLVYKNQDVPAEVMDPIRDYRREVAAYLAKCTEGQDPGARPKPPVVAEGSPKREALQEGIAGMEALMDKYGPPPSKGKVVPLRPKAPADSKVPLKEAAEADVMVEGIGSQIVKAQGDAQATDKALKPYDAMVEKIQGSDAKLAEKLAADLKTLRSADPKSPEYQEALGRVKNLEGGLKVAGGAEKVSPETLTDAARKVYGEPAAQNPVSPYPKFQKTIDGILSRVPPEKLPEARKAVQEAIDKVPSGANEATVGKVLGTELRRIEANYAVKAEAPKPPPVSIPPEVRGMEGPVVDKLSQSEVNTLAELQKRGLIDEAMTRQLMASEDAAKVKQGIGSWQGFLDKIGKTKPGDLDPQVSAYNHIRALILELTTAERGAKLPGANPQDPRSKVSVKVDFDGVKDGKAKKYTKSGIDNDVPVIPGRVWELKRYPRLEFGSSDQAYNQVLKYQEAIRQGHFDAATIEVSGNVDPVFLRAIRTGQGPGGIKLEAPNVEVLYSFTLPTGREVVIPLKEGSPREGSDQQQKSLRYPPLSELNPQERAIVLGMERALADGKYELFGSRLVTEADFAGSPHADSLQKAVRDGAVDPKLITDVAVFKEFERLNTEKRAKSFEELGKAAPGAGAEAKPGLHVNEEYLGFQKIEVTKIDETKPWKPPLEVEVTKADGSVVTIPADTPFFTFVTADGKKLTVSAAAAEHIDSLHIRGTEAGSHFDYPNLQALFADIQGKLPVEAATSEGPYAVSIPMGRNMGKEGIASMAELRGSGILTDADVQLAQGVRQQVFDLNLKGTAQEKQAFIDGYRKAHPEAKVQFQLVRDSIIVPVVDAPKRDTQNLFLVFGPDGKGGKTLWTAAPGRNMPKHPDPKQHMEEGSGKLNEKSFKESADAWFDTVMLQGRPPKEAALDVKAPDSRQKVDKGAEPKSGPSVEAISGPAAVILGVLTLIAPDVAQAAEGPIKSAAERGGIGPFEAGMLIGIGTLVGMPFVAKYLKARYGSGEAGKPFTHENPLQVVQEGKTTELYPQGKGAKPGPDERSARINKENSSVLGDQVYLALEYAKDGKSGAKSGDSGTLLPMTRAEAERLGVKFDKAGNITSVPKDPFIVKPPKAEAPPPIDVVADSAPAAPAAKVPVLDPVGRPLTEVQPLQVGEAKGASPDKSFGKILSAEPVEGDPKKVVVTVETYSPGDPAADPTGLAFGIGKPPKAIERRQFVMDREAAMKAFGLQEPIAGQALRIPNNPYVVLNDSVGIANPSHPVVVRDGSDRATVLYPADRAGQKGMDGTQIWVDPAQVSYLNGQFNVFYERGDFSTGKVHKVMEPLVLNSEQARRLGIAVDHEGKVIHGKTGKDGKLSFVMGKVEVGKDETILLDGKPFDAEHGPISVQIKVGKGGEIRFIAKDGTEVEPPAPQGVMLSGTAAGQSKLVAAAKAAGPLGVALLMMFSPETAHASTPEYYLKVAETVGLGGLALAGTLAITTLVGMAFFGKGGGGKPPQPNHHAIVPTDGVTSFSVGIDAAGRPTMNPIAEPAMTFERGPQGQWYFYEGRPLKTYNDSKGDPQALAGWKPVKDGDIYGISDAFGRQWVLPFQAPKDAWIPGYAPPAVVDGIVPAASGKLPVGKVSLVRMKDDGSPFVIGRGEGDLRFEEGSVSGVHATIVRDPETGQHYLIDGALGNAKTSTNGVVYSGVKMSDLAPQYRKAVPIQPGDYFAINGAYFKFEPSPVQPVKAVDHPAAGPVLKANGQDYAMRLLNFKDTMIFGPDSVHGSIQSAHSYPNDPKGRVVVTLSTHKPSDMKAGEGRLVLELTREQAAQIGLKMTPDGKLDPSMQHKLFSFSPIQAAVPMADAAYAQPAQPQYGAKVRSKFDNQEYDLQVYQQGMPWDAKRDLGGEVQSAERLPNDPQGRYFVKVGYREGNDPNAPVKTLLYNLTPAEAYSLGMRFDASGKLEGGRKYWLKVTPQAAQGAAPGPMVAPAPKVAPTPKPALVSIDPATGLPKGVYGALGDNVPGQTPRRGELRGKLPTGTYAARTHEGMGKDYNEDGFVQGRDFAVVIDEVGSGGSHGQASKIFGQAVAKYIEANRGAMEPGKLLTEAFRLGNDAINASPYKRSSVVAVAQMVVKQPDGSHKAYIIHRGDARAMVVDKEGKILHVTQDESVVEMTHGKAKEPGDYELELKKRADPEGNVVLGALGGGHAFVEKITVTEVDLPPRARIVLATDGVTDSVSSKELAVEVTKTDDAGKAMDEGFQLGLTKMSEGLDAAEMLKFQSNLQRIDTIGYIKVDHGGKSIATDRAPLMSGGEVRYVRRKYDSAKDEYSYEVYDAPVDGKLVDQYTRKGKLPERLPVTTPEGEQRYMDYDYNLWDKPTGGKMVDHYKPSDNITLHVYIHDPEGKLPTPSGSPGDGGTPPPPSKRVAPPPAPPRPLPVTGQKKNLTGAKGAGDAVDTPAFQSVTTGESAPAPAKADGSYELSPGILVRRKAGGGWEVVDTRDPAALAAVPKFNIHDTQIFEISRFAEYGPFKVNGKELKPGEPLSLQPGDRIGGVLNEWQFHLPGPKPWDGELAKLPPKAREGVTQQLSAAKTLSEVKAAVTGSGIAGSEKIVAELDACLDGRVPVSVLPQALQEPMLRFMEAQAKQLAQGLPKGYKPELDVTSYRGGFDPRERAFHTNKAAVLFAQEFEMASTFGELRKAFEGTLLSNPEGHHKDFVLSQIDRFEKGEIGIQDIPAGMGLRQKFRDLWEAKNLRLMEGGPDSGRPKDPAAEAALQNMDSRAFDIYGEIGRIGSVRGSAKTYSVAELRELVYEVLERGKPLDQLPTAKGVRAMVENYMRTALAEARFALRDNLDFKRNFFTGEELKERDFNSKGGPAYVESLQAKYRFVRMYLNQKAGRPVYGEPSQREMNLLSTFSRVHMGKQGLAKYSEYQAFIRDELGRLTPKMQAALKASDPETRSLVLEAFFGTSRHRQMNDVDQAMRIAAFLGKIDFHREIGVTADILSGKLRVNLTLGEVAHVSPEEAHLYFLFHTHPNDYTAGGDGNMGINQTMALGQAMPKRSTLNVLFSTTDVRLYVQKAQDIFAIHGVYKTDVSAFYDVQGRVFRNWVQHTDGVSQAEVQLDAQGKPQSVRIRYGLYAEGPMAFMTNADHLYSAEKLRQMSRELGVPVTVERVDPASIEAQMPYGKK